MASVVFYRGRASDGKRATLRRIEFTPERNGKRLRVRLGAVTAKVADDWCRRIESLLSDRLGNRAHEPELATWLGNLDEAALAKLRAVGLADGIGLTATTLGAFLERYFAVLDVKESTRIAYTNTRRNLEAHFGSATPIRSIDEHGADAFRAYLKAEGLAAATISKRLVVARSLWRKAIRWKLAACNPFEGVTGGQQRNEARNVYVPAELCERIIRECPDAEWRAIVALARYGGVRTPSETFALKWTDVDFDKGTIRVSSPKTERYEGHATRMLPMFPELRQRLTDAFHEAADGAVYVVAKHRLNGLNLRTQFLRLIRRAGVNEWPRLFQNLRSSRVSELLREYDIATVSKWAGHSPSVLAKHYATSIDRDADFARASAKREPTPASGTDGARAHHRAQHSAQQHATEPKRTDAPERSKYAAKHGEIDPECADVHFGSSWCKSRGMGPAGLEPATKGL
ncbi:MAG: tyrosine-type recombinase/integrase [Phycisphaerae bacterium]